MADLGPGIHSTSAVFCSRLWQDAQGLALECLHHPFVAAMAQDVLPRECFQHYVAQDAYFLEHFALAYAMAMAKAHDCSDEVYDSLSWLLRGVHRERRLHIVYATEWGVDLSSVTASPATLAYTDFLMDVARGPQGVVHILAAMAPCSRLYGFLGCQLAAAYPGVSHVYADWIRTYSSADYLALPALKERLIEGLATESEYGTLQRLYTRAMQLEVDFFSAQPYTAPPRALGLLVVDFDETCSDSDTIGNLMTAAVTAAAQRSTGGIVPSDMMAKVEQLAANYVQKQRELLAKILPSKADDQLPTSFNEAGLHAFLEQLSDFDVAMNQVVVQSGVLAGLSPEQLHSAGQSIALQPHCRDTLHRALQQGLPLHVVSVNWSAEYVAAALGLPANIVRKDQISGTASKHHVMVVANRLQLGSDGTSTGGIEGGVEGARDKGQVFSRLASLEGLEGATVYIGDSTSDLLPLLKADYGIVVGTNGLLRTVARHFGIQLKPLSAAPLQVPPPQGATATLYEASSWQEIQAFLFGPGCYSHPAPATASTSSADSRCPAGQHNAAAAAAPGQQQRQERQEQQGGEVAAVPRVLTIAGSDSGGGAGIQADLKAMMACGVFGMSAITALTAQNTHGVQGVWPVPLDSLSQQIDAVLSDLGADAVKTGMLPSEEVVKLVADKVRQYKVSHLVVDPVMVSTSGHSLAGSGVAAALRQLLFPLASIITPNLPEASALLGGTPVDTIEAMEHAAQELHKTGCRAVLIKGGHLAELDAAAAAAAPPANGGATTGSNSSSGSSVHGNPSGGSSHESSSGQVIDVLYDGRQLHRLTGPRFHTNNTHGTGCTLASAIASGLARGLPPLAAVQAARGYLTQALCSSVGLPLGTGVQRPFNHGYALADWSSAAPSGQQSDQGWLRRALRAYVVTDPGCNNRSGRSLLEAVQMAIAGGATMVQLREKDASSRDFLAAAKQVAAVCRAAGIPLIINDRLDIALAAGPDVGLHVGQDDMPVPEARRLLGPSRILGVSVKTVKQAQDAVAGGADYLGAGAVYPTGTKESQVIGLEGLAAVCAAAAPVPVVSIGGVTASNAAATITAGCAGAAVVSAVFAAPDPAAATKQLLDVVAQAVMASQRDHLHC